MSVETDGDTVDKIGIVKANNIIYLGIIFVWCCLVLIFEDWSYEDVSTYTVDICDCLTNASYYNNNENDCDKAINKELGYNWKTTNYSQEPSKSAKFDALAERCNLAESASKEGVVSLPSGLQYKVITPGDGPSPLSTDRVKVHYKGTLVDGTVFDSSYDRGQPASNNVTGFIKGWVEALLLMQVGSKWELTIPSKLGYGTRGSGAIIPPNSTLLFEIELLAIE